MTWLLTGNSDTDPAQHFLGTTDEKSVIVKTAGVERATVTAAGNVGIGVHEPRTLFHVLGRFATGLDHASAGTVTFFPPDGFGWFHIDNGPAGGRETGRLWISGGANPGDAEFISIQQDGRVGIGASTPPAKFTVEGEAENEWGTAAFHRQAVGKNWSHIHWGRTGDWYIRSASDDGRVILQDGIDGNVGIGTSTPEFKLDVSGNARVGELHVSGTGRFSGTVQATDFVIPSDARLKGDVKRLTGALGKLVHVRGVSFDWNESARAARCFPGRRQIGILAQELEEFYPELVVRTGTEDYRAIDYAKLSAVLLEAIKELKFDTDMRLTALESEVAVQRAEISRLRGRELPSLIDGTHAVC